MRKQNMSELRNESMENNSIKSTFNVKKIEWKKENKQLYLPKNEPQLITIPSLNFFTIRGKGNPNNDAFGEYISVLYTLSYAVRMSPKSGNAPTGYYEYTVYPLEGVWDFTEKGRQTSKEFIDKDEFLFHLMIRQPDFVSEEYAKIIIEKTASKKPHPLISEVKFETINEGKCVQMMHIGKYDDEPASFEKMENFAEANNLTRTSLTHREIYISDPRRVNPEKKKTVLRFQVK